LDSFQDDFRMTFQHINPSFHVHHDLLQIHVDLLLAQRLKWSRNLEKEPDFVDGEIVFIVICETIKIVRKLGIGMVFLSRILERQLKIAQLIHVRI
jgi:hypothetical protein